MNTLEKKYTQEEVRTATLDYFKGDTLATDVWIKKYCLKDETHYYELTPDDMHRRISKEIHRIEMKYPNPISESEIFESIKNFKRIVPQGSPMSDIGNDLQIVSLSNCFVVGNSSDSYGGIMKIDQELVQLEKRRGGVGTDLSFIRPCGSPVKNSAITSTGVVPFMERFSNTTIEVAQDGRRGALMLSLSINHPDVERFVDAKLEQGKVTGANISVKLTDEFMDAAINGKPFIQKYPIDSDNPTYIKEIDATKIWKKIIYNAWKSAEPGLLFWDTIINESIPDCYSEHGFKTTSTNPCGEIPLCPDDSCRLLCLNLFGYVKNPFTSKSEFDWGAFKKDSIISQRYMDDIIDLEIEKIDNILKKIESDPEDEDIKFVEKNLWLRIKEKTINGRRTGLGVTGEGDMLASLGFIYGTDEATIFSEEVHKTLKLGAYRSSVILSKERGSFPIYDNEKEKHNPFINRIKNEDINLYNDMVKYGRRNIALLTIAPTGTSSIMTQTTSGIEPAFLPIYMRRRKINPQEKNIKIDFVDGDGVSWSEYPVFHHKFEDWLKINGYDVDLVKLMSKNDLNDIVKKSPYYKATSNDVDWVKKVEMQGRIQKHVDHSISVTVNLPNDTPEHVVSKVYETGWKCGCKGITVYRDGSRYGVLIGMENNTTKTHNETHIPKRPKKLKGEIYRFQNNLEKWIAVVGLKDGQPYEIFTGKLENGLSGLPQNVKHCDVVKKVMDIDSSSNVLGGRRTKSYDIEYIDMNGEKHTYQGLNYSFNPEFWNYAKFISGVLRHGMPIKYVSDLVLSLNFKEDHINTWKNGVSRVLKKYVKDGEQVKGHCSECGQESLEYKEGCLSCSNCGNTKC